MTVALPDPTSQLDEVAGRLHEAEQALAAERELGQVIRESYADLEQLYRDDQGWKKLGAEQSNFTGEGRKRIAGLADLSVTGNALIKKGMALRIGYVWGQGVTTTVDDDGAAGQDVNAVWQAFTEDPTNRAELTASEAQVRYERRLGTAGEAFFALPTDPMTGRVRVRRIPADEIVDRICDPEDAAQVWFFKRTWTTRVYDQNTGRSKPETRTTFYPALGYWPTSRARTIAVDGTQGEVRWDAPIRPVCVNVPDKDWRGVGDVLAALPWAKMDKEFLEDLAVYMRALTRILGQVTSRNPRMAQRVTDAMATAAPGSLAATDPNTTLSLVSKSGAQIDADSHRPFATMVAAALEVPLTMLLGDPGITGARATAETLDQPTENTFNLRRQVHTDLFRDIAGYVIDQAVIAPRGPLRGTVARDLDRLVVTLPEGDSRTLVVAWPDYDSTPLKELVDAIVAAEGTGKLPPVEVLKLLARAFELDDVDDLVEQMTDEDGNWLDPELTAAQSAVDDERRRRAAGQTDPVEPPADDEGDA